jgi:hypothetical protein
MEGPFFLSLSVCGLELFDWSVYIDLYFMGPVVKADISKGSSPSISFVFFLPFSSPDE